ncbi:hypothetical protein GC105_14475 [Alkalibaculum sp. M08DMB]|uniref:Uncharacterized protein n=1 Tax=Alkalibaculum sporogenes TaxID=2655001 RepID=A0A6A7KCU3_9FIRM|nr:hypothetical protein [Alkalibaculum sporogenes]MPW26987.1 hypothetical protein [Alkalibaculum sporogenes]
MSELKEFQTILQIIVSRLAQNISNEMNIIDKEALNRLYASKLYEKLEQEETKVWHLSVPTLYSLFMDEQEDGKIIFPEEA